MDKSKIIKWIITIFNIILIVLAILFYQSIFSYLIISAIFAYLIAPIIDYLEIFHIPRVVSILGVYIIIILLVLLLMNAIVPVIVNQFNGLQKSFSNALSVHNKLTLESLGLGKLVTISQKIEAKIPSFDAEETLNSIFNDTNAKKVLNAIPRFFKSIFNIIAFLIVIPVISFFLLKDGRLFLRIIFSKISNRYFEFSIHLMEEIEKSFGRFFRYLLLETLIVAILSTIGLLILNIPYALVLGLIVGLANPIKYFGPFIGAIPTMLVILIGPTPEIYLLYATIMFFIVQQIDSLFLFPVLIGKSMDMHPMIVLLTVIAGGYTFGILGMLFAVPLVFLIKIIVQVSHKSLKDFEII